MTIEERRRRLLALDPLEELLKDAYLISLDGSIPDEERSRRSRQARKQLKSLLTQPDFTLRGLPEDNRRILTMIQSTGGADRQSAQDKEHLQQSVYGLEGIRNVRISAPLRYLPGSEHDHAFIEISYVMKGTCTHQFFFHDMVTQSHMREGSVLIIPPGQRHKVEIFDDSCMLNILIRTETFQKVFLSRLPKENRVGDFFTRVVTGKKPPGFILIHTRDHRDLDETLLAMLAVREQGGIYADAIIDNLMENWFLYMLEQQNEVEQAMDKGGAGGKGSGEAAMDVTVLSILMYIDAHFAETSLADVQSRYHFSPSYLNRIFRRETGTTIQQYILDARMQHARRLLEETGLPVAAVAAEAGYEDPAYFTTSFRRKYGISPTEARNSLENYK